MAAASAHTHVIIDTRECFECRKPLLTNNTEVFGGAPAAVSKMTKVMYKPCDFLSGSRVLKRLEVTEDRLITAISIRNTLRFDFPATAVTEVGFSPLI